MKKKDLIIVVALLALWLAWPTIDRTVIRRFFPAREAPPVETVDQTPGVEQEVPAEAPHTPPAAADDQTDKPEVPAEAPANVPEQTAFLENDQIRVGFSSRGASVKSAELKNYGQTPEEDSPPVRLDFSEIPALAYSGLDGLSVDYDFEMQTLPDQNAIRFERAAATGLRLRRTISLGDSYMLTVQDELINESGESFDIPKRAIQIGAMRNMDESASRGTVIMGVDYLATGGQGVQHLGGKIPKWFGDARKEQALAGLPRTLQWPVNQQLEWAAVKNKYFVQILTPEYGGEQLVVNAVRETDEAELQDPAASPRNAVISDLSASILLPAVTLQDGESLSRQLQYYVGPKNYGELSQYGMSQADVMELGMWAPIGKILLSVLNSIHSVIPNYGIAIILLTILIRIIFWPITHKSTESMKKMQDLQPLITELRQKHKDNPQRQQQEIMALYKEHKVNPLGGCLPTLIQIPVFFALFGVLRSAIELRFAPFLWISDLSAPERLLEFGFAIPLVGWDALNILPLVMAATMVWQQKLTPGTGDPNQQRMMIFMPIMMLLFLYNFASGLVLYWTTNQCLMIIQQLMMRRKKQKTAVASAG